MVGDRFLSQEIAKAVVSQIKSHQCALCFLPHCQGMCYDSSLQVGKPAVAVAQVESVGCPLQGVPGAECGY